MNTTWQPITRDQLAALIEEELAELPDELKIQVSAMRTPLCTIKCQRNFSDIIEEVFIVGRYENYIVIFDDVEEEFAIAQLSSEDKPISRWRLSWNLMTTLQNLKKIVSEHNAIIKT